VARQAWIAAGRIAELGAQALSQARRRLGRLDRRRFARFRSDKRRREFLAGRCLLQRLGKGLPFDSSPEGGVKMTGRFGASISHARGWVACVVVSSGRPGIDIEPMIERDFDKLGEWAFGRGGSREEFYQRWTRYEARIKAFGDGAARASHAEHTYFLQERIAVSVCAPAPVLWRASFVPRSLPIRRPGR
jgi:phosphopantetheinyl transferase